MTAEARVLIVDDDIEMCKSLSDILTMRGYEVFVAHNGFEAIDKVKEILPHVVLLDIKMPGMNGVEAFKRIKTVNSSAKVIMITAYSVEDLIREALGEGAFGVIYKPFDIEKCIKLIEQATRGALIMIVDDDPHTCQSFKDVLDEKGHIVTVCKNGEEAIQRVKHKPHSIFFIDIKLPVLNGLETYLAIKKINPGAKAVMMTAFREEVSDIIKQAKENNVYACLYKPFNMDDVIKITEALSKNSDSPTE